MRLLCTMPLPLRLLGALLAITVGGLGLATAAQAQQICYAVADAGGANGGDDLLTQVNRTTAAETAVGTGLGTNLVEAIAYSPFAGKLYGANAGQFGEIDLTTGVFSNIGSGFGSGDGVLGSISFSDVDGLHFDPYPGELHGVHRRGGANENDLLFQIDRATGAFIPGAFPDYDGDGTPDDYLEIQSGALGVWDIDDLAIDPVTGTMYATGNNGGSANVLLEIDRITGTATLVGSVGYDDIEGISFDTNGDLFGSSGNNGGTFSDYLFEIDPATGAGTPIGALSAGSDYEGLACLTDGVNQISGRVFQDDDEDGVLDLSPEETGQAGITVRLFRDNDGNGQRDSGEPQVGTQATDGNGDYLFEVAGDGDFVIMVLASDLPQGSSFTTDDVETASFAPGTYGGLDARNDFGYTAPPATGDLTFTKSSNATEPVPAGFTITYTLLITNTGAIDQTGVAVRDTLPDNITFVANSTLVTPPPVAVEHTYLDSFDEQDYDGSNGATPWPGSWTENNDDGSATGGTIQVKQDGSEAPYAAEMTDQNDAIVRTLDLTAYDAAEMTFRYRGAGTASGDKLDVKINGTKVTQVLGSQTTYTTFGPIDLTSYTGGSIDIEFKAKKLGNGTRAFWVDDVQVTATGTTGGTPTAGNAPPLLTSGHTIPPGEQLTVTFQATVDANPATCIVDNTAWVTGDLLAEPQSASNIVFINDSSCGLPVELVGFEAVTDGDDVLLAWQTASETNNAGFELQHRAGEHWTARAFITGYGTTIEAQHYRYRLEDLAPGRHRFRLKQIDYDGTFEIHPEVEVIVALAERFLVEGVYPNPMRDQGRLRVAVRRAGAVKVGLYDVLGKRVREVFAGRLAEGTVADVVIDGRGLPSGLYLVQVEGQGFTETRMVTVVR